jgi:hypothetical protein
MKVHADTREAVTVNATIAYDALDTSARDVLVQLFLGGPTWDGYLVSKQGRDTLVRAGFVERAWGFQWLTCDGVMIGAFALQSKSEQSGHGPVVARQWRCKQVGL